jgi:hypothetical protein
VLPLELGGLGPAGLAGGLGLADSQAGSAFGLAGGLGPAASQAGSAWQTRRRARPCGPRRRAAGFGTVQVWALVTGQGGRATS